MPIPDSAAQAAPSSAEVTPASLASLLASDKPAALERDSRIRARPNDPFLLRSHPERWEVATQGLDAPTWLPTLIPHPMVPGVNGVRTVGKGENPVEGFRESVNKEEVYHGCTYIQSDLPVPDEFLPDGVPAGGWLRSLPCVDIKTGAVGKLWTEAWNVPLPTAPNRPQRFEFRRDLFNQWRKWLVEQGLVPLPEDYVLDEAKGRIVSRIDRKRADMSVPPEVRDESVTRDQERLKTAAAANLPGTEPKKKKRGSK